MKLFKDYIPYLVDDQSDKEKRYPTKALKWKSFKDEKPKDYQKHYVLHQNDHPSNCFLFNPVWITERDSNHNRLEKYPELHLWIEAEAYETAKAKEDMWLPLGDGWDDMSNGCFYNDQLGVAIFIRKKVVQIDFIKISSNALIPIEICTLEIVQKLIENIKELEK